MTPITPKNFLRHEIIGLKVRVSKSTNNQLVGVKGTVIDETRNTFTIFDGEKRLVIPKDISVFHFRLPNGTLLEANGRKLIGSPENRVKMRVRRW